MEQTTEGTTLYCPPDSSQPSSHSGLSSWSGGANSVSTVVVMVVTEKDRE